MDFRLTPEQAVFVDSATRLAEDEFGRVSRRQDIPVGVPRSYLKTLAAHGFSGISIPEHDGGQGAGLIEAVLAIEAIARVNPAAGDAVQAMNFGAVQQIAHIGSKPLKRAFLGPLLAGDRLTAIAMTESEAGSAVTELLTRASYADGEVKVHGSKLFTTHGADADFFVVWVRFGAERADIGAVVVERGTPGFHVDASNRFMSGEHYGVLTFEGARVPTANVLIDRDGLRAMLHVFNIERLGNSARALALGQAAFDIARQHALDRRQFGRPLADFQGLQWRLAEMSLGLESARLLLYRAATGADQGLPSPTDTAMAKLACNRAGFAAADGALQLSGGQGFDDDSVVSYLFHRTRGWMIAGGTVEQMLNRLAKGALST